MHKTIDITLEANETSVNFTKENATSNLIEVSISSLGTNAVCGDGDKSLTVALGAELSLDWNHIENIPPDLVHDIHYVHTDNNYTTAEKSKLSGIEAGAEVNVLESVKVNGSALPITDKAVNIVTDAMPTNGSANPVQSGGVYDALSDKQDTLTFDDVPTAGSDNPVKSGGIKTALDAKQDTISDLAAIRSGAALGATAYQKPVGGIPSTDLSSGVNTSLGKADTAYQKPSGGIPSTDMTSAVQTSLGKADAAYQKPSGGIPSSDMSSAVQTSLGKADTAIQDISGKQDVLVSGTNIKTINNESILGSGNITIQGGGSEDAVLYTEQELTSEQQAQARTNIGAGTVTEIYYNPREADFEYILASGQVEVIISRDNLKSVLGMNDKLDSDELYTELGFEEFDSSQTYGEGNCVVYQGDLYMFTSNHSGAWDANDVDEIALTSILQQIIDEISSYFGNGSLFGGIVTPNSQPTYGDDHHYYYLAIEEGSYTYFNNRYVSSYVNLLYWSDNSNSWVQKALWPNSNTLSGWLSNKADKVTGATNGNLAGLDEDGNLTDSGSKASDFATASQGTKADTAYQKPSGGIPASDLASAVQTSLGKADTALQSFTETDPTVPSWAKASTKPTYTASEVGAIPSTDKGANGGVATLDNAGKVPSSQLPSYVDDVLEYSSQSAFPSTGETGKIYVALDTNKTYRWSGSAYVEISESLALGETSSTAFPGDRGKAIEDVIPSTASSSNKLATENDIPTVPTISTDISADATSDTKTASPKAVKTYVDGSLPTKTSDLTNDSGFVNTATDQLVNYYTTSQTYTQAEVDALIAAVNTFEYVSVQTLPTASSSTMGAVYIYNGHRYITQEDNGSYSWVDLGSYDIDLSGYVTTTALNTALEHRPIFQEITETQMQNLIDAGTWTAGVLYYSIEDEES